MLETCSQTPRNANYRDAPELVASICQRRARVPILQFVFATLGLTLRAEPFAPEVTEYLQSPATYAARQRGFTLLEVVLAVALTGTIMFLVAGAIDFHLRQLTVRRTNIEEAQIARAVLRRIADDLRAVVVYRPADFSSVEAMTDLANEASAALSGDTGDTTEGTDSTSAEDIAESNVATMPGLYGNQSELQIDVSRIPRYEEYQLMAEFGDANQIGSLSDLKSVTYFVLNGGTGTGLSLNTVGLSGSAGSTLDGSANSGLVRQVVSRASSRWASISGDTSASEYAAQLIAPEIVALEFAYFDGFEWLTDWDSELNGGIPMAVEIALAIQSTSATANANNNGLATYRLVVHLPGSEPYEEETTTTDGSTSTTGGP